MQEKMITSLPYIVNLQLEDISSIFSASRHIDLFFFGPVHEFLI